MLRHIIFLTVFVNASSIYYFRKYSNSEEKGAFYSGIIGLVLLPVVAYSVLLAATNIQGIHGDLGGFSIVILIWFIATCKSCYSVIKFLFNKKFKKNISEENSANKQINKD